VALAASGLPSGASASFSPASVTAGGASTLTVNAGTAAPGTYLLTVTGASGSITHGIGVTLVVTPPVPPDFSISASPASLSIARGGSATSIISTAVTAGAAGTIALGASVSPAGLTVSLSPTSVTAGAGASLSVSVGAAAATGSYTVTITGTEGTSTHSVTIPVTVTASGGGIVNGGFETGTFFGWAAKGRLETIVSTGCHGGTYCAQLGGTSPTGGDSTATQTFTVPPGMTQLSLWYKVTCPDTVDWAAVTLRDDTARTTTILLPRTCTSSSAWVNQTAPVSAGHSYTLTLISHDGNRHGGGSYTLYDDVTLN
jgi:hypothetical protein